MELVEVINQVLHREPKLLAPFAIGVFYIVYHFIVRPMMEQKSDSKGEDR